MVAISSRRSASICSALRAGPSSSSSRSYSCSARRPQRCDGELRPEARVHDVARRSRGRPRRAAQLARLVDARPRRSRRRCPVRSPSVSFRNSPPSRRRAQLDVAHEQRLGDLASVCKFPDLHRATKIEWRCGRQRCQWTASAIVTGGTGGLGAAVVARLLDDGWRVVVPWIVERELERVQARDGLELVQADLFDPDAVSRGRRRGRRRRRRPAARARQPGRRLRRRRARARDADRGVREAVPAQPAPDLPGHPGGRCRTCSTAGGGSIVCVGTRAALQPVLGRGRLHLLEGGRDRVRPGGRGRVQRRRDPLPTRSCRA